MLYFEKSEISGAIFDQCSRWADDCLAGLWFLRETGDRFRQHEKISREVVEGLFYGVEQRFVDTVARFQVPLVLCCGGQPISQDPAIVQSVHEFASGTVHRVFLELDDFLMKDALDNRSHYERIRAALPGIEWMEYLPEVVAETVPKFDYEILYCRFVYEQAFCMDWMLQRGFPVEAGNSATGDVDTAMQVAISRMRTYLAENPDAAARSKKSRLAETCPGNYQRNLRALDMLKASGEWKSAPREVPGSRTRGTG